MTVRKRAARGQARPGRNRQSKTESRYTVGLTPSLAHRVKGFAKTTETSVSKAIATLVRLGIDSQNDRKRAFFQKLKDNLSNDDLKQQDRLVDEFRALILGR